jgi:hypothetical protein
MSGRRLNGPHLEQINGVTAASQPECAFTAGQSGADDFDASHVRG